MVEAADALRGGDLATASDRVAEARVLQAAIPDMRRGDKEVRQRVNELNQLQADIDRRTATSTGMVSVELQRPLPSHTGSGVC